MLLSRARYALGLRDSVLSRLPLGSLTLRPGDSLTTLLMASSMGFRGLVSPPPAIQATGHLAFAPAGLTPAEHVCLLWTHTEPRAVRRLLGALGLAAQPPPHRSVTAP
jgi:hypothetical protein